MGVLLVQQQPRRLRGHEAGHLGEGVRNAVDDRSISVKLICHYGNLFDEYVCCGQSRPGCEVEEAGLAAAADEAVECGAEDKGGDDGGRVAAGVPGQEEAERGHQEADGVVDLAHGQRAYVAQADQGVSQVAGEEDGLECER